MKEPKIVFLNLDEVELYGWEKEKSWYTIDAIVRGIELGDDFPAVKVIRRMDGSYEIASTAKLVGGKIIGDGGHSRATGHYIGGKPLKCMVVAEGKLNSSDKKVRICDVVLTEDLQDYLDRSAQDFYR